MGITLACPRCGRHLTETGACLQCTADAEVRASQEPTTDVPGGPSVVSRPDSQATVDHVPQGETNSDRPSMPMVGGYALLGVLGRGGMGVVYKANQVALKRVVALKMILAAGHAGPRELARFKTEAESVARLQHPNIVQVYEVGEADGHPFFALEFVSGGTLSRQLGGTPQPTRRSAEVVRALAEAMQCAHDRGVVHRDLKPANVLLTETGTPKVTDFGLAKQLDTSSELTGTGAILGTPCYMAPEQATGRIDQIGATTDVYALGAILYEMLTGRPPFKGETAMDTMYQVTHDEPVTPRQLQPKVPRDLETICLKCLSKDPAKRYPTAQELAADLGRFLEDRPIRARPVGVIGRTRRWVRRNPAVAMAIAAVVVTVVVAFGLILQAVADANRASAQERKQRREAQVQLAQQSMQEAYGHCEHEGGARGILWLARAVKQVAELDVPEVEEEARLHLTAWSRGLPRVESVLPVGFPVDAIHFTAGGKQVWLCNRSANSELWDLTAEKRLAAPKTPGGWYSALDPVSRTLFKTGFNEPIVQGYDAVTGAKRGPAIEVGAKVEVIATGGEGKFVATSNQTAGNKYRVRTWDAQTGKPLGHDVQHSDKVYSLAFDPKGQRLVTGGGDSIARVWDVATSKPLGPPLVHSNHIEFVGFGPTEETVTTICADGFARLWLAQHGKLVGPPLRHEQGVSAVAVSRVGLNVATAGGDRTVRVWDGLLGSPTSPPMELADRVASLAFVPDRSSLLVGGAKSAQFWKLREFAPPHLKLSAKQVPSGAGIGFRADGRQFCTIATDGTARLWDAESGASLGTVSFPPKPLYRRLSLAGETLAISSVSSPILARNIRTGQPLPTPAIETADLNQAFACSPDGRLAAVGMRHPNRVQIWDFSTGTMLPFRPDSDLEAVALEFNRDGTRLATGSESGVVQVWDVATGQPVGTPMRHALAVSVITFSPDGKTILSGSNDGTARLWEVATGKALGPALKHDQPVSAVSISHDGRVAATGCVRTAVARLWDVRTSRALGSSIRFTAFEDRGDMKVMAFTPDSRHLLSSSRGDEVHRTPIPTPITGSPERLILWSQVVTGMELDDYGAVRVLASDEWKERRRQLQELGGAPIP